MSGANQMPETELTPLVKAQIFGSGRDGTELSNVMETPEDQTALFTKAGAVPPPLDLMTLAHLFELSGALRSNVDAYTTNIDSFGHRLEPVIDPDADDAKAKVALAITQERMLGLDKPDDLDVEKALALLKQTAEGTDLIDDPGEIPEPTDEEVEARLKSIRREMIRERIAADKFFSFVTLDESFEKLRMKTRQDLEVIGNAYWEVLRNGRGEIVQFDYVPGYTIRLTPADRLPHKIEMNVRPTLITQGVEPAYKRFRRFVQVAQGATSGPALVWFKEYGDPRVYSHLTGREYASPETMKAEEADARPATELIHFKIHNSRSLYGLPRWVSELIAVVGSRHADDVNLSYFENKSVPPLAILVSGGRLVRDDVTRIENYVKNEIRGKRNFHKIMVLQAEGADNGMPGLATGRVRIEIKPLTDSQHGDAQFMKYKEANTDAIGSVFRLPRLLRGDAKDFNRATAQTSLEFTEQQVFAPLRKEFDYFINRCILPELGINFWTFCSKGPDFSDPSVLLEQVNKAALASYLTPEELRKIAGRGFGVEFPKVDEDWVRRPIQLTLGGITTGQTSPDDASASRDGDKVTPNAGNDKKPPKDDKPAPAAKAAELELSIGKFTVLDGDIEAQAEHLIELAKAVARKETEADGAQS